MPIKLNISDHGKAWRLEVEPDALAGKNLGDKFDGKEIKAELEGYELEITGGTDFAGFPMSKDLEGVGLKKTLLSKGWGMHDNRRGIRLRRTLRGKSVTDKIAQLNIKVLKHGHKKLAEIFPDQNKPKDAPAAEGEAPTQEIAA